MELYIHVPFCVRKCRYCSFVSFTQKEDLFEEYTELILKEASQRSGEICEPVRTVYIGGGTPSVLPLPVIRKMLKGLHSIYDMNPVKEFTCEANPGTLSDDWLACAVEYGVNRLSIGMQAYQPDLLKTLGRIHQFDAVAQAVNMTHRAGIHNINLDLIFGIPGQNLSQWADTIGHALSLQPSHISAYGLIPEEGTPLYDDIQARILSLPDPDDEREMYDTALNQFRQYGMKQYEISNFAIPGRECIHNIGYWSQVPYIGLGVSASSMTNISITDAGMTYLRKTNPASYSEYRKMVNEYTVTPDSEYIGSSEARFETMMLGLRLNEGVNDESFRKMHGISVCESFGPKLGKMMDAGLLLHENGYWKMTRRGLDIQNMLLVELLDD